MTDISSASDPQQPASTPPVALTIAGFDPSSGAGMTADLKTFAAHGLFGVSCITSLTVQSTQGVWRSEPVAPETVRDTLRCLAEDVSFATIKIGMLGSAAVLSAVAEFLETLGGARPQVVLDPVLWASAGQKLIDKEGVVRMRNELLRLVDWVTPNTEELGILVERPVISAEMVPEAALQLQQVQGGKLNVVVTGGHLSRPDDFLRTADGETLWLPGEWVKTRSTHGTGCAYSSALACRLALGDAPVQAARGAKSYVAEALRRAVPVGKGRGPMAHLWPLGTRH